MKAYKIIIDPYEYEIRKQEVNKPLNEGAIEKKIMYVKYELPRQLCNPQLGTVIEKGQSIPHKEFDLLEIGPLAQRIEQTDGPYMIVNSQELDILKKRVKIISNYFGYFYVEMFLRIMNAKETVLEESETTQKG